MADAIRYRTMTTEEVREYNRLKDKYLMATTATPGNEKEYAYWLLKLLL